jgi:hypothetical protein
LYLRETFSLLFDLASLQAARLVFLSLDGRFSYRLFKMALRLGFQQWVLGLTKLRVYCLPPSNIRL